MTGEVRQIIAASRSSSRPRVAARLLLAAIGTAWLLVAPSVHGAGKVVDHFTATGVVDNVMASYLADGIANAEKNGAAAVVIELNTPGGSLDSMNQIVTAELEARVPVIVWVAPAGAAAASAGTFITLAGNLAYMAPGTNIGAASPVGQGGQDIGGTEGDKIRSYAISKITAIAEERGRNVQWAVSA